MADLKLETSKGRIWTRAFILLCLAQFLGYSHHALLTPTLPLYLTSLGSSPFLVGLLLASFSASAVVVRPALGYWTDSWHMAGVLVLGCVFLSVTVLLFIVPSVEVAFLANSLRGVSWSGLNTAGYALLATVVPADRRGEASGFYSGIQSSASIFFPALGLWLLEMTSSFTGVFVASAGVALTAAGLGFLSVDERVGMAADAFTGGERPRLSLSAFFDRSVFLPGVLLLCMNLSYAAVSSFVVLYARDTGIENLEWYFVAIGTVSLLGRPLLGRVSDRIGRGYAVASGCVLEVAGVLFIVIASDMLLLVFGGVLYFLGYAIGVATTLALAMERSDPARRGRAMATFSMAFPLGGALGAILAGGAVDIVGYRGMYVTQMAVPAAGLLISLWNRSSLNTSGRGYHGLVD